MWTNSGFSPSARRKRIDARRAWKASKFEQEEISLYAFSPGQPDLEVVGLRGGEAEVAGRERHDAVGQLEPLQHLLGVRGQRLERGGGILRAA